jgi:hypothetical protein
VTPGRPPHPVAVAVGLIATTRSSDRYQLRRRDPVDWCGLAHTPQHGTIDNSSPGWRPACTTNL